MLDVEHDLAIFAERRFLGSSVDEGRTDRDQLLDQFVILGFILAADDPKIAALRCRAANSAVNSCASTHSKSSDGVRRAPICGRTSVLCFPSLSAPIFSPERPSNRLLRQSWE